MSEVISRNCLRRTAIAPLSVLRPGRQRQPSRAVRSRITTAQINPPQRSNADPLQVHHDEAKEDICQPQSQLPP